MTVKQLIKKLEKLPQNLTVAKREHDNTEFEISSLIHSVYVQDFSNNTNEISDANRHEIREGKMVIIQ